MKGTIEKVVLAVLGAVILGYLYYAFYLSSQLASINGIRKSISNMKQSINKLQSEKVTIDSKIEQEKNQGSEVNDDIPDILDKKYIIQYFYNLIKNYNLKADKIALTESTSKDYQSGTVSFKVSGTYDSVRNFMYQIENDKRKFVIKQANISNDGDNYSSTMTVEYYALKPSIQKQKP